MEAEKSYLFLTKQEEQVRRVFPCGADIDGWFHVYAPGVLFIHGSGAMWDYGKNLPPGGTIGTKLQC